ncbi:MAG: HEAT repeat domain-containing protein [Sphaerospermopsis sp. SIO1G2]|nr:HEAT repeat domain-containing protein [Sphaerospermopsis sp. SIO1G1]NET73120.1 HEAT repeat domain-containing protein [Sphaerospermopsis sp. SIO1G2]
MTSLSFQKEISSDNIASLDVESLIANYHSSTNQNEQASIIKILAELGDEKALDLLVDVVGVEVANHCQGNVRRVAARGLEKMVISTPDAEKKQKGIDKLSWALLNAEDWGLRYAAAISLGAIATIEINYGINTILDQAMNQESDKIVNERIRMILNM